jgi:serine/threonine-protein kinase
MDWDDNELENLKNRYKIKPKESKEQKDTVTGGIPNKFLKLFEKGSNGFKYIVITLGYFIVLFLLVFIADKWIMPSIVHDRETVIVPSIEGKTLKQASELLNSHNLYYEIISEQYSGRDEGTILKQIPKAEEQVKSNRPIYITISKGKEIVKMPSLIGTSIRSARVLLYDKGLNVGEVRYEYSDNYPNDSIISQSIGAGSELVYGDTVSLVVSKGSEFQVYTPKLIGLSFDGIETYIASQGFKLGNVEFVESSTFVPGTITSQTPPSNTLAMPGSYINIVIAK